MPCCTSYHPICITVGSPFCTRFFSGKGPTYPSLTATSGFICEACTVQVKLGWELRCTDKDLHLLRLERMRLIGCTHAWAPSTLSTYKSRLKHLQDFQSTYDVIVLEPLMLKSSLCNPSISLMWAMQVYALSVPSQSQDKAHLQFNTIQGICNAAAFYYESLVTMQYPHAALCSTHSNHPCVFIGHSPTDHLDFTQMATGMSHCLGTTTTHCLALSLEHSTFNQSYREI
eukprot:15364943-Ditylum_brightwellii.AAC.1